MITGNFSRAEPKRFKIYGERCSGTNFICGLIKNNFPHLEEERLYNWEKHSFVNPPFARKDTIAIVVVREAMRWLQSLHRNPHQVPRSFRSKDFSDFIRHEWSSVINGKLIANQRRLGVGGRELLFDRHPVTGERIRNVVELRNLKTQSYLKVRNLYKKYLIVRYEDVVSDPSKFIAHVSAEFACTALDPFVPLEKDVSNVGAPGARDRDYATVTEEDRQFILDTLDLEQEAVIGYRYV